jgi:hypothetical protein
LKDSTNQNIIKSTIRHFQIEKNNINVFNALLLLEKQFKFSTQQHQQVFVDTSIFQPFAKQKKNNTSKG